MSPNATDNRFRVSSDVAYELVELYGTPMYVMSEDSFRANIRRFKSAFEAAYPKTQLAYASKANNIMAILAIAFSEGCLIDVASEGEFRAALRAGVPASSCHLHGNYKTLRELEMAFNEGIGGIVADSMLELHDIANLAGFQQCPDLLLRLAPGVNPITHEKISTGQQDTKFGFNASDGAALEAVQFCLEHELPLKGFHCHVGSQILDGQAQIDAAAVLTQFAVLVQKRFGFKTEVINWGGGLAVKYLDSDNPLPVEEYCVQVVSTIRRELKGSGLEPTLIQEPGRALIGETTCTLYRVGPIKSVPLEDRVKMFVAVDGGLADNPRPALYDAAYHVERVWSAVRESGIKMPMTISGRHCETDRLFSDVHLPVSLQTGDIVQVLSTGAYNSSMASNYNRYKRPPTVLLRCDGSHDVIQRSETWDETFGRESVPEDLF